MADPQASKTSALPTDTASATPTGSKFSALPDIDTSAIDVYETPSSPELKPVKHTSRSKHGAAHGDAGQVESDDSNDDDGLDGTDGVAAARRRRKKAQQEDDGRGEIDSTAIPSDLAKARFKDSTDLASEPRTTSQRQRRRRLRRPSDEYLDSESYEIEPTTSNRTETPIDRLRRLRWEAAELEEQLTKEAQDTQVADADGQSPSEAKGATAGERRQTKPNAQVLLRQLRSLRLGLDQSVSDSVAEPLAPQQGSLSKAKAALSDLNSEAHGSVSQAESSRHDTPIAHVSSDNVHLANIEERLAFLESLVGSSQGVLEETQSLPRPLLPTVARLEHLATLITQPRHIDAVSKRIKLLVAELDRVYEARRKLSTLPTGSGPAAVIADGGNGNATGSAEEKAPLDPITLSKLDDAFALCSRLQPLLPLAPALLQRLRSLSQLHSSAANFASTLDEVDASQKDVEAHLGQMVEALKEVSQSLTENEQRTKANLDVVMQRMEQLDKRIAEL